MLVAGWQLLAFSVAAQPTLDAYLQQAAETNPGLKAAFAQYQAALEMTNGVGVLENPQVDIGLFLRPMELLMGNQRGQISVMQMFPWFGLLKAQKSQATLMAEAKYEAFRAKRNELFFQVKNTYFQLAKLEQASALTQANLELLQTIETLAIVRYQGGDASSALTAVGQAMEKPANTTSGNNGMGMEAGSTAQKTEPSVDMGGAMGQQGGTLTDVLRLQRQIKALQSQLEKLALDKAPLQTALNQLTGSPTKAPVEIDEAFLVAANLPDWAPALRDSLLAGNPMVLRMEKEILAFGKQEEIAALEGKPMIGLGLSYMLFSPRAEAGMIGSEMGYMPPGMGNNMLMPMLTMSLPIYRKKYRAMQAEAAQMQVATRREQEDLQIGLSIAYEQIVTAMQNTDRQLQLLAEQAQLTEQMLEMGITAFANGESTAEELLGLQRELLDFELEQLNLQIEKHRVYAQMEMLLGY